MMNVLFVDDEPGVLEGLENRLRCLRRTWRMRFALGARNALEELSRAPYDAVVTDMRMPDMDGAQLLRHVQSRHAGTLRIVLTGQTDQAALLRSVPLAHQLLSKPCDAATLQSAVLQARDLLGRVNHSDVRAVVSGVDTLPSLPRLFAELSDALESSRTSTADVARIVEQDPAMSARVLQLANSAFFGPGRAVVALEDAVTYLGINALRCLLLSAELFTVYNGPGGIPLADLERYQRHSLQVTRLAGLLLDDPEQRQTAASAAILHDIGTLVGAVHHRSQAASDTADGPGVPPGIGHAELGAHLLSLWGLPFPIIAAVAYHHEPLLSGETELGPVGAVHIADRVARAQAGEADARPDAEYVAQVGAETRVEWLRRSLPERTPILPLD